MIINSTALNPITTTETDNFVNQRRGATGQFCEFRAPYYFEKKESIFQCFINILINQEIIARSSNGRVSTASGVEYTLTTGVRRCQNDQHSVEVLIIALYTRYVL